MGRLQISFQELQNFISRYDFEKGEKKHFFGKCANKELSQRNHFKIIAFGILDNLKSLRDCVTRFNSLDEHLYHMGVKKKIALSTLSEANKKKTSKFYEDLFYSLLQESKKMKKNIQNKFSHALRILDSTTITLSDSRATWAKYKSKMWGLKVHLLLDQTCTLVDDIKITPARDSDCKIAKTFDFSKDNMYVMDRAYFDSKWLYKLHKQGVFFTLRLKNKIIYKIINEKTFDEGSIRAVKTIQLMGEKSQIYCEHLRLIVLYDKKTNKTIEVITNNFKISLEEVSDIYRKRWEIENFFRWIKQNLQIKRFYGRSENAMKTQIWIAMILYLLLWKFYQQLNTKESFLNFVRRFKARLLLPYQKVERKTTKDESVIKIQWEPN